jgi:hypothetical protein
VKDPGQRPSISIPAQKPAGIAAASGLSRRLRPSWVCKLLLNDSGSSGAGLVVHRSTAEQFPPWIGPSGYWQIVSHSQVLRSMHDAKHPDTRQGCLHSNSVQLLEVGAGTVEIPPVPGAPKIWLKSRVGVVGTATVAA